MRKAAVAWFPCSLLALGVSAGASGLTGISGDYLEVRTADVYTGPCFANGEVNLTGKEAVLAWTVRQGSWQGVALDGLSVVAVVKANATLGDPHANPYPTQAVVVVDEKATPGQREALLGFARSMAGALVGDVVAVKAAPIWTEFRRQEGFARVAAGDVVQLATRALEVGDNHCGNEYLYYPPLTDVAQAVPAYALAHSFSGPELGTTWSSPSKRSAFIATFSR